MNTPLHVVDLRGISRLPLETWFERLSLAFTAVIARRIEAGIGYEVWLGSSSFAVRDQVHRLLTPIAASACCSVRDVVDIDARNAMGETAAAERELLRFRRDSERIVNAWRVHVTACAAALARRELDLTEARERLEELLEKAPAGSRAIAQQQEQVLIAEARVQRERIHHQVGQQGMARVTDLLLIEEQRLRVRVARGGRDASRTTPPTADGDAPLAIDMEL